MTDCEHIEVIVKETVEKNKNHKFNGEEDKQYYLGNCRECGTTLLRAFEEYKLVGVVYRKK